MTIAILDYPPKLVAAVSEARTYDEALAALEPLIKFERRELGHWHLAYALERDLIAARDRSRYAACGHGHGDYYVICRHSCCTGCARRECDGCGADICDEDGVRAVEECAGSL